ncbi:MAG: hypothetical protein M1826_001023 [Phylliscum demangeonii]|nr:MAG: hypothetical protein M1826_001023 [Phylliscum demangeonii]
MANAVSDCGKHHGRHVDSHWFDNMEEGDTASHFRHERQTSQFSTGPFSAAVPRWAKHLGIGAQHLFAGVATTTRRLSAVDRRVLQKEATLLKKDAVARY